jgi:hypothetical protein
MQEKLNLNLHMNIQKIAIIQSRLRPIKQFMIIKVIKTALIFMKNMITLIRNRKIIQSPMTILISIPNIPIIMVMSIPNTHMIVISIQINVPTMINIPILTLMNLLNLISTTIQTIPIMFQIILTSKQL